MTMHCGRSARSCLTSGSMPAGSLAALDTAVESDRAMSSLLSETSIPANNGDEAVMRTSCLANASVAVSGVALSAVWAKPHAIDLYLARERPWRAAESVV